LQVFSPFFKKASLSSNFGQKLPMRLAYVLSVLLLIGCKGNQQPEQDPDIVVPHQEVLPAKIWSHRIMAQYPHDTSAYTQGLFWHNNRLYEGTGDYEQSSLRVVDLKTGNVIQKYQMGTPNLFGEGITLLNGKIYQLTWENKLVYVYDMNRIDKPIQTLQWPYEGWGITNNGKELIISDGSSNLYFVQPSDLKVNSIVSVKDEQSAVKFLNELEYVKGSIFANVYQTNQIIQIDPETGRVIGKVALNNLLQSTDIVPDRTDVLNGIAYDSARNVFFITGKRWPKLFEMSLEGF
jgi:glutamine cyclotransferase